jgi:TatD DNase family protein
MSKYPEAPDPLPRPVIDSHCHLDIGYDGDPMPVDQALAAAAGVGVVGVIQVGCDLNGSQWAVEAASDWPNVWAAVALHPNEAPRLHAAGGLTALESELGQIAELSRRPEVRAVGETGMDFYRTEPSGRAAQEESFRAHIQMAKDAGKALVVHDREAHPDILRILDDEGAPDRVVMHCFSGDAEFAREVTRRGYFCSFAGVVTFKNADGLREALLAVPPELVLVETDAPFLTPVPNRGRPNASFLLPLTVRTVAAVRQWPLAETCDRLVANTESAFGVL